MWRTATFKPPPLWRRGGLGGGIGFTRIGEEERRDGEAIALHKYGYGYVPRMVLWVCHVVPSQVVPQGCG